MTTPHDYALRPLSLMEDTQRLDLLSQPPQPLGIGDSVGALLVVEDEYLLQRRDIKPGIVFPGFLSLFGGALEAGEEPADAICRELEEELGLRITQPRLFGTLATDWSPVGVPSALRWFFEVRLTPAQVRQLVLNEGAGMVLATPRQLFAQPNLSPIDAVALWYHSGRNHFYQSSGTAAPPRVKALHMAGSEQ